MQNDACRELGQTLLETSPLRGGRFEANPSLSVSFSRYRVHGGGVYKGS